MKTILECPVCGRTATFRDNQPYPPSLNTQGLVMITSKVCPECAHEEEEKEEK